MNLIFLARKKECQTAVRLRQQIEAAKGTQKTHYRQLLDAHKRSCKECSGKK